MNTARMAILGVAAVAGVISVGVLTHGLAGAKPAAAPAIAAAPPPMPTQRVLVASRELEVGERIQGADMTWQTWPAEAARANTAYIVEGPAEVDRPKGQLDGAAAKMAGMAKNAISNPADGAGSTFVGAIVRERIAKDEPLIAAKVVRAGQSGVMAVTLDPGMRAVALPLSAESAAGGFILPGDHVDVILTRSLDGGSNPTAGPGKAASTVMRNVRVLAIDQNMGASPAGSKAGGSPSAATSAIGATATVEVSPEQAEHLVLAKASGTLTLSLRSYADAAGPAEAGAIGDGAGSVVRVFRNSAPTPVTVTR